MALRRQKNLVFSEDTCLEKESVRLKVTPRKVGVGLKRKGLEISLMGRYGEEAGLRLARIERKTPVIRPAIQSDQSPLCSLYHSRDRGRRGPNGQIVSIKRTPDGRRQRSRKIINEKREKYRAKNGTPQRTRKERLL